MSDLDKIKARIRALREKTMDNGCTEAEALAAAEVAARIMAEHGLSDADVVMTSERTRERTSRATWRSHVSSSCAHITNTAAILLPDDEEIEFIGKLPGPEIAAYLYAVLCRAVEREVEQFKFTAEYRKRRTVKTRRIALTDFRTAMTLRLRRRLFELFRATSDSNERALAHQALKSKHLDSETLPSKMAVPRFGGAVAAGWAAGGKVTLAHGVGGKDGKPLAIGGQA